MATDTGVSPIYLETFPNECLIKVLVHLPLPDQLRYRRVCSRWNAVITLINEKRESIKILVDIRHYVGMLDWFGQENNDALRLKQPGDDDELLLRRNLVCSLDFTQILHFLSTFFGNIKALVIQLQPNSPFDLKQMSELLSPNCWPNVQQLSIISHPNTFTNQPAPGPLFSTINELNSLTHFDFFCLDAFVENFRFAPGVHLTTLLPRLKHFGFYHPDESLLYPALVSVHDQLQSLDVKIDSTTTSYELEITGEFERFCPLARTKKMRLVEVSKKFVEMVQLYVPDVEELDLRFNNRSQALIDSFLFNQLSYMRNLVDLKLNNIFMTKFDLKMLLLDISQGALQPLAKLKRLEITQLRPRLARTSEYNGTNLVSALAALCPELEELTIRYDYQDHFAEPFLKQIRDSLAQFEHLVKSRIYVRQSPGQEMYGRHPF